MGVAIEQLARVVKPGGRVGALEWQPPSNFSPTPTDLQARLAEAERELLFNLAAPINLARYFQAAGLVNVRTRAVLDHTEDLDKHPFWHTMVKHWSTVLAARGFLTEQEAQTLVADV